MMTEPKVPLFIGPDGEGYISYREFWEAVNDTPYPESPELAEAYYLEISKTFSDEINREVARTIYEENQTKSSND
jgi:hypothetical protein